MNEIERRELLGKYIRAARRTKYRTVERARQAAQVSRGTWDAAERGDPVKDFSLAAIEQALDWPEGYANEVLESEGHQPPSDASHHVIEGDVVDWIKQSDVLTSFQKEQLLNIVDALQEGRVATREGDEAAARRAAERLAATAPAAAADARRRDESGTSEQASQRRRRA